MKLPTNIIDPKVKKHLRSYVFQCSLAALVLFIVLTVEGAHLSNVAIIAAIGSTAFVLFVTPHSVSAAPRHVIGGHLICLALGSMVAVFDGTSTGQSMLASAPILFDLEAAVAVGLGIFTMATTNTEHAPAAGTALGVAVQTFSFGLVLFVITSVLVLQAVQLLLRPRLRDLL